ncbi:hypothetical protein BU26DRAFT_520012 [Trematosphaeria pertusa]|uniref:DUF7136 domain-containing protein n=1 Tax=Trematosphaeria pertusa TaxID=390896 RepID=A0A6A6IE15_9PLEO|nr:uncharacterized protein BU26DRAFT_520012 [Trematosphaeria pertusa]KAF2248298.1 hypothetical protein BU26DRAFT_520012 [Trematosphaeria pertusa]
MARILCSLVAMLAACRPAFAETRTIAGTTSTSTSTPAPALPTFEIDIIFPRINETYNWTTSLPIAFAFQNLSAAAALGSFRFIWTIMPYNSVSLPIPGGVREDSWEVAFSPTNASSFTTPGGSPYILVNNTNPYDWDHPPNYGGTAYALQWYIQWDTIESQCDSPAPQVFDHILFTLHPEGLDEQWIVPNSSALGNVTGNCAQLGSVAEIDAGNPEVCSSFRELSGGRGNPCALKADEALVSSISSVAGSLATAQSLASATPTTTRTSSTNVAVGTEVPVRPAFAAAVVFGGLEVLSSWYY